MYDQFIHSPILAHENRLSTTVMASDISVNEPNVLMSVPFGYNFSCCLGNHVTAFTGLGSADNNLDTISIAATDTEYL